MQVCVKIVNLVCITCGAFCFYLFLLWCLLSNMMIVEYSFHISLFYFVVLHMQLAL
jgi:hypothetical protein